MTQNPVPQTTLAAVNESSAPGAEGLKVNRRTFVCATAAATVATMVVHSAASAATAPTAPAVAPVGARHPANVSKAVTFTLNGTTQTVVVEPRTTLLDALRDNLHLTGTKKGCDRGQCGACTVLANGRRINACLTLAVMHDGHHITTIEGIAKGNELHPVQAAFLERDAFQCGYCTPGQICSAVAAIDEIRAGDPSAQTLHVSQRTVNITPAELRERMSGNLCRCGAYPNIVLALEDALASMPVQSAT